MSATMQRINLQATVLSIIISLSTSILEPLVWIEPSSPLLPRETGYNIPAYNDGSIWLVGGVSNITIRNPMEPPTYLYKNLMSYNITNNSFTLHPDLSQHVYSGYSQNWAQIGDTLYIHRPFYNYIGTFNLTSKSYVNNMISIPNLLYDPCITDVNGSYLILLGGNINYYNQMQIFDLEADQWISDGPPMLGNGRREFTCNSINGFLYAIGGTNKFRSILDTVIMLDIDNIFNITNTWIQLTDTLSIGRYILRSVVYHDLIFVLGGMDVQHKIQDNVDVINTTTNTISFNSNLSEPLVAIAAIVVDDTLFVLSGTPSSNQWQCASLLSQSTTSEPTTHNPTTSEPTTTETLTTTPIERNCDCTGGMVELTVQYIGECNANITTYYDIKKRLDEILPNCVFNNVAPGDSIICTAPVDNGKFKNKLYFDIDCVDYRRRLKKKSSQQKKHSKDSKSKKSKSNSESSSSDEEDKYCTAKLDTSCDFNIIGKQSKWCGDLKVISYVSGDGSICDETVIFNNEHAVINDERTESNNPLKENVNQQGSATVINIFIIIILLIVFLIIGSYCVYIILQKKMKSNNTYPIIQETKNKKTDIDENSSNNEPNEENHLIMKIP